MSFNNPLPQEDFVIGFLMDRFGYGHIEAIIAMESGDYPEGFYEEAEIIFQDDDTWLSHYPGSYRNGYYVERIA